MEATLESSRSATSSRYVFPSANYLSSLESREGLKNAPYLVTSSSLEQQCQNCLIFLMRCADHVSQIAENEGQYVGSKLRAVAKRLDEQRLRMDIWMQECGFTTADLSTSLLDTAIRDSIFSKLRSLYDQLEITRSGILTIEQNESQIDQVESQNLLPAYQHLVSDIRGLTEMQSTIRMAMSLHSNDGPYAQIRRIIATSLGKRAEGLSIQDDGVDLHSLSEMGDSPNQDGSFQCTKCYQYFPQPALVFHTARCSADMKKKGSTRTLPAPGVGEDTSTSHDGDPSDSRLSTEVKYPERAIDLPGTPSGVQMRTDNKTPIMPESGRSTSIKNPRAVSPVLLNDERDPPALIRREKYNASRFDSDTKFLSKPPRKSLSHPRILSRHNVISSHLEPKKGPRPVPFDRNLFPEIQSMLNPKDLKAELSTSRFRDPLYRMLFRYITKNNYCRFKYQLSCGRRILVTNKTHLHLVVMGSEIFVKPLPAFLLDHKVFRSIISVDKSLYEDAMGMLASYILMIVDLVDFEAAYDHHLIPSFLTFAQWTTFSQQVMNQRENFWVSTRYSWGELRLNWIGRLVRHQKIPFGGKSVPGSLLLANVTNNSDAAEIPIKTKPPHTRRDVVYELPSQRTRRKNHMGNEKSTNVERDDFLGVSQSSLDPTATKKVPLRLIPAPRNPCFTGRTELLDKLYDNLLSQDRSNSTAPSCVLSGIGGVGKTQLALEYCYHYSHVYDSIFWICASNEKDIRHSVVNIGSLLGISSKGFDIKQWLELTDRSWLVVFDHVEDPEIIVRSIPTHAKNGSSGIIITSQLTEWGHLMEHHIHVDPLNVDDSLELFLGIIHSNHFLQRSNSEDRELDREISRFCGGLPLAIQSVASFAAQTALSVSELRDLLKRRPPPSIWGEINRSHGSGYDKAINTVFDLAIESLPPDALKLLKILAFLDGDHIPEAILLGEHSEIPRIEYLEMLTALYKRGLVTRNPGSDNGKAFLTTHRLLQKVVRFKMDYTTLRNIFDESCSIIRRAFPPGSSLQQPTRNFEACYPLISQAMSLIASFEESDTYLQGSLEFIELLFESGFHAWQVLLINESWDLLSRADNMLAKLGHESHPRLYADIQVTMAMVCDYIGIDKELEALQRRQSALRVRLDSLSSDSPLVHNLHADIALSVLQIEGLAMSQEYLDLARDGHNAIRPGTEFPFEYVKHYRLQAFHELCRGNIFEAVASAERHLELAVEFLGRQHPQTLVCRLILGGILEHSGHLDRSLAAYLEAQDSGKPKSIFETECRSALGMVWLKQGQIDDASEALSSCIENQWEQNAECHARTLHHLSQLRGRQGRAEEATQFSDIAATVKHTRVQTHPKLSKFLIAADDDLIFDQMVPFWAGRNWMKWNIV